MKLSWTVIFKDNFFNFIVHIRTPPTVMSRSERLQSSVAIFIATIALMISVWQGCEQRKHNRLSVRPLLNFDMISYNTTRSIKLSNNGLGPAVIKSFRLTLDGKQIDAEDGNPWASVIQARSLQGKYSAMYYFADGSIIKPEETYSLFTWTPEDTARLDITINIQYNSLYEEEYRIGESF